ncbi:MAG: filamentous hemagglutinin N-terminal domain-containing protein, partial [Rhodobacterales bacterium]|nr:filamentous hemagglutinin N-terminal domain-containing protein [Rhodobacterales bacterium]
MTHAQEIIIDPNGNVGFAPSLQRSARPQVVDIARPNEGGVSHNRYDRFDVTSRGVVLNNAQGPASTSVAGNIAGNPNLANGTATTIVNEVTSARTTTLNGAVEVAGDRAGVIIANPNGISCNGCNFINAGSATLTTGVPVITGGNIRLDVTGGSITIGRNGLRGATAPGGGLPEVNLIGRTVVIDGQVSAIDGVNVLGGAQQYDLTNKRRIANLPGSGAAPDLVIDGTEFGAMTAGRIQIIGNEAGLGVRTLGAVQSTVGDVQITGQGNTTVRSVAAQGRAILQSGAGDLTLERDIVSATRDVVATARNNLTVETESGLFGQTGVNLNAGSNELQFDGVLQSGANATLYGRNTLRFAGYGTAAGNFSVAGRGTIALQDSTVVADRVVVAPGSNTFALRNAAVFSGQNLNISTHSFSLGENVYVEARSAGEASTLTVTASGNFTNSADLDAAQLANISFGGHLFNEAGGIIRDARLNLTFGRDLHNSGVIFGAETLTLNVASLFNNATGTILSDSVTITTSAALNNAGAILSEGQATLVAGTQFRNEGLVQAIRATITAPSLLNTGDAALRLRDSGTLTVSGSMTNAGLLTSAGTLQINAGQFANNGSLAVETSLIAQTESLTNAGVITAGTSLSLRGNALLTSLGTIASYGNAALQSNLRVENRGLLLADNSLQVIAPRFDNAGQNAVLRAVNGDIRSASIVNSGEVYLVNSFRRRDNIDLFDNAGVFATQGFIEIANAGSSTARGQFHAGSVLMAGLRPEDESQTLATTGSIVLRFQNLTLQGSVIAGGGVTISGPSALLINGTIRAGTTVNFTGGNSVGIGSAGIVQAGGAGFVTAASSFTNDGLVSLGGAMRLGGGMQSFTNRNAIAFAATDRFTLPVSFTNTGVIQASSGIAVTAGTISNTGLLQSVTGLSLAAQRSSVDPATGLTVITRGGLSNTGMLVTEGVLSLTAGALRIQPGSYLTGTHLQLNADSAHNYADTVLTGAVRGDWNIAQDYRQYGTLFAQGALRINAGSFQSYTGSLLGSSDSIALTTTGATTLAGSISARTATLTAAAISGTATSSIFTTGDLRLAAASGRVGHLGELVAGANLTVTSREFDIRGSLYGANVMLSAATRATTFGNLYAGERFTVSVSEAGLSNYGLIEARDLVSITSRGLTVFNGGNITSTEIIANATGGISNAGTLYGARQIALNATAGIGNQTTGVINAASLGVRGVDFINNGDVNVFGLFGTLTRHTQNFGRINAETYVGITTANFYNRANALLQSGEHLHVRSTGTVANEAGARLLADTIDLRGGALSNAGLIRGQTVTNIADLTGALTNAASGRIEGRTIALLMAGGLRYDGVIGTEQGTNLVRLSVGREATNNGQIAAQNVSALVQQHVVNAGSVTAALELGLKSNTSYIGNSGVLRGRDVVIETAGGFDNQSLVRAGEDISVRAGGDIRNRVVNGSVAEILAPRILLHATGAVSNNGRLFGYQSLGVQADTGAIHNSGVITGPDITLIARNDGVWSPAAIVAGGSLAIEARSIGLRDRVTVTNDVTLRATHFNIEVDATIQTRRLMIEAARDIVTVAGALRGSELVQIVANDIQRPDGVISSPTRTRKLGVIGGTLNDVYVELRTGSIGTLGPSIFQATGHAYEALNWTAAGSVSLITGQGNILLTGNINAANDLYIRAGTNAVLNAGTLRGGNITHVEGARYLKNYGGARVTAGTKVQLSQTAGWFYTADWFSGDLTHDLSVQAETIIVNSSHRLVNRNIYLLATQDIRQRDHVISARGITYSAGRDMLIRFNPFNWRAANPGATLTGDFWDRQSAGLRGNSLLSQGAGMVLYAGRNLTLQSGKVHSGGSLNIVAGNTFLSEPIYIENGRTNRPGNVGWDFDSRYTGVVNGHNASNVTITELRAYENQITARNDLNITAGGMVNLIGTRVTSSLGNVTLDALNGGINMVAAPGFWSYNYTQTTTRKKFFGFFKRTTRYEYDAAEDIYKRAVLNAVNGDITLRATGTNLTGPGTVPISSILSAGTEFNARNIRLFTPNGNITAGTYAERSIRREETHSSTRIFWFIPFGSSDSEETNSILVNYGNDFLADELLSLRAPQGTLSITGGSIRARSLVVEAAQLQINGVINSARQTYFSRRDNMITITTIQSGFDRETAAMPEIFVPNITFNVTGQTHIAGYRGTTLNSQIINLIGSRQFNDAMLGIAPAADAAAAQDAAQAVNRDHMRSFTLPGATDGAQFAYLDVLMQDYGATYHAFELRDHSWYDKQVQLNPAFRALLQVVVTYAVGGINFGIENAFVAKGVEAATTNLVVGV